MSSNPYINYYVNQAGSGIGGFHGARFQRGHGWFKSLWQRAILPLLKYVAPKAINTGAEVAIDAIKGENVVESLKKRGRQTAKKIAQDAGDRAMKFVQTGSGRRRKYRKRRTKPSVPKKHYRRRRRTRKVRRLGRKALSIFS